MLSSGSPRSQPDRSPRSLDTRSPRPQVRASTPSRTAPGSERCFDHGLEAGQEDDCSALPEGLNRASTAAAKKQPRYKVNPYSTVDLQGDMTKLARIRKGLADIGDENENLEVDIRAGDLLVELGGDPSYAKFPSNPNQSLERSKDDADVEAAAFFAELSGQEPMPGSPMVTSGYAGRPPGWQAELQLSQHRLRALMQEEGIDPTIAAAKRASAGSYNFNGEWSEESDGALDV